MKVLMYNNSKWWKIKSLQSTVVHFWTKVKKNEFSIFPIENRSTHNLEYANNLDLRPKYDCFKCAIYLFIIS